MKHKNIIGLLLIIVFVFAVGCGSEEESAEPAPAEEAEVTDEPQPAIPVDEEGVEDIEEPSLDEAENETEIPEEEPVEDVEEPVLPEEELSDEEGVTDISEDEPLDEEDELTADNYRIVSLKDLKAYPSEMIIKPGTTVEWRNVNDNFQHIIGWKGQKGMNVDPEPILQGQSWSYTFNEPCVVEWFSTAKPTIQGTITVEAEEDEESSE